MAHHARPVTPFFALLALLGVVASAAVLGVSYDPEADVVTATICSTGPAYDGYNGAVDYAVILESSNIAPWPLPQVDGYFVLGVDYFSPKPLQSDTTYTIVASGRVDSDVQKMSPDFPAFDVLDVSGPITASRAAFDACARPTSVPNRK